MTIRSTLRRHSVYATIVLAAFCILWPVPVSAGVTCGVDGSTQCPEVEECDANSGQCVDTCGVNSANCNRFIETYINPVIIALTALVGIAAVISIIYAGIQYSSSADDPGTVSKAKQRIFNTLIGLVAYIFLFAFLNYLVPGGILR